MASCHDVDTAQTEQTGQPVIALAGNPNCGKTTVFNLLTGAHQHVGNWPGVTVEQRRGTSDLGGRRVSVIDLPGVYSLLGGGGADQSVARNFLLDERVDLVVNIVDASNLERHLALTAELLETSAPMVLVLNMVDEARSHGLEPRIAELSAALGVPVVPMVARKGQGRQELFAALAEALKHPPQGRPCDYGVVVEQARAQLAQLLGQGGPVRRHFDALRLIEGTVEPQGAEMEAALRAVSAEIEAASGEEAADVSAAARFGWAHDTAELAMHRAGDAGRRQRITERLDHIVLNSWLGVPIFLAVLYLVFVVSFSGGNIFIDFFDQASSAVLIHGVGHVLLQLGLPDWLVSVVAGGIGGGLNLVITFIPPIGLTFLLLAILDDSGYMARAAYAMDLLMRRLGLPGNALVPMVIGFGCNVPAIMGSRIIEDPRGRLLTVLMQPFMSCSARLTIYMAFAVVFFRANGGQVVFLLYVLGIVVAFLTAWLLGKTALTGEPMPFLMELPPYRLPSVHSVLIQSWQRLKVFLFRVGRVIAVIGLVLFVLPGVGWVNGGLHSTDINHSLLAQGSRALVPIFKPMGITDDNWPAVSGLVAGAAAKEIVIGTLNGVYQRQDAGSMMEAYRDPQIGAELWAALKTIPTNAVAFFSSLDDPLGLSNIKSTESAEQVSGASSATLRALAQGFTPLAAFSYLVFVLLYVPCASTMGALRREVGWGWMGFSIGYGISLAWGVSTIVYQLGTFSQHPQTSLLWVGAIAIAFSLIVLGLRHHGKRRNALGPQQWGVSS